MGKRTRKTRWRTLEIGDSDSEESCSHQPQSTPRGFHPRPYYSKFHTFSSSQSTPTRRFNNGCDNNKSTRSSSTASDTKITFNEDEYTKITTPRQDVLFKKGYLNKPRTYQTQTSTGNSTSASTGNSTGNGTPDHQSADGTECTDVEYESQFVFPTFLDHNGIYYVNSFEPYPLMMYNPQVCYPEFPVSRTKRLSTGSLTESTSPNNEEIGTQSGGENGAAQDLGHPMYMYQGFYYNNPSSSTVVVDVPTTEPRKIKKKRRRKASKSVHDDELSSSEEESSEEPTQIENKSVKVNQLIEEDKNGKEFEEEVKRKDDNKEGKEEENVPLEMVQEEESAKMEDEIEKIEPEEESSKKETKFNLNAEEFIPRALRQNDLNINRNPNVQFVNVHSNFIPLPFVNHPLNEIGAQPNYPAMFPPGIPLGFVPPNFVNFVPNQFYAKPTFENIPQKAIVQQKQEETEEVAENVEKNEEKMIKSEVDIAKIVSKLEEAAKEQRQSESGVIKRGMKKGIKYQRKFYDYKGGFEKRRNFERKRFYHESSGMIKDDENKDENKDGKEKKHIFKNISPHLTPKRYQIKHEMNHQINVKKTSQEISLSPQLKYSETVKKSVPQYQLKASPLKIKEEIASIPKSPNQWIAVSNRKKRKNRSNEEEIEATLKDDSLKVEEEENVDEELVVVGGGGGDEVLILTKEEEKMIYEDNKMLEDVPKDVIELIRESSLSGMKKNEDVVIQDVQEIEKEMLKEKDEEVKSLKDDEIKGKDENEEKEEEGNIEKEVLIKKVKKTKKQVQKRILVKDCDFINVEETEEKEEKIVQEEKVLKEVPQNNETLTIKETDQKPESIPPEKKKPKKKKKIQKINPPLSKSSSTTTLNNPNIFDESYDFLLDTTSLLETNDKTNVEVSEELDKMIQKGLFGNLEEKMKTLNVSIDEDFFKSLNFSKPQSTPDKSGFIKATDLSSILTNNNQFLQKAIDYTKIKPDQASTSKDCAFLDVSNDDFENTNINVSGDLGRKKEKNKGGKLKNKSRRKEQEYKIDQRPKM
nr:uncharacterized protein LOC111416007 isoform X2 [Onthophagus taurus]